MTVRTRFAPSPTGDLHLGNARTAALNWALARRHGGSFVLRFEDTDVERNVGAAEARIREALEWLGLEPDEGPLRGGPYAPYRQSERGSIYRETAAGLLLAERAYSCYCTSEELATRREAARTSGGSLAYDGRCRELDDREEARLRSEGRRPSVRFAVEPGPVTFRDRVRGEVTIDASEFGDFVILRSDGRATYNFAAVVDDVRMEISHVVRGVGHLDNTPKQILLYRALDAPLPEFAHIPHVRAPGGGELSKREGARSVLEFREVGYHPEAVFNYLSLLSWSSESGDEFLTRERIVEEIDLDRIGRSDAEVDPEKMRWLSGRHIRAESVERLAERLEPFLTGLPIELSPRDRLAAAEVLRERIQLLEEGGAELRRLFVPAEPGGAAAEALASGAAGEVLRNVAETWSGCEEWERASLREAADAARERLDVSGREFYHPVRAALTGALEGPEVPDLAYMLGRERTLERLRAAVARNLEGRGGDVHA